MDELRQKVADEARGNPSGNTNGSNNTHNSTPYAQNPPVFVFDAKPNPTSMPQRPKNTKKRFFGDDEPNRNAMKKENMFMSSKKLKKDDIPAPAPEQPQDKQTSNRAQSQPVVEFEDISDEVERRLKLREERRRKRYLPPQKKRKRESGVSVVNEEVTAPKLKRHRSNGNQAESENIAPGLGKDNRKISAETSEVEERNGSHNRKKTKRSKGGQV